MPSIIVPAHNEERTIPGLLLELAQLPQEFDVFIVCNGCTDRTAEISRQLLGSAHVLEVSVGSKPLALNLGDQHASRFPRVYLDADVTAPAETLVRLVDAVGGGDLLAAAPNPSFDVTRSSWFVRSHWRLRDALAGASSAISGTGCIVLSAAGRSRFRAWPDIIADDYFVDGQFAPHEKARIAGTVAATVAPRGIRDCVSRRARIHQGNRDVVAAGLRAHHTDGGASSIGSVLRTRPRLILDLPAHIVVAVLARGLCAWRRWRHTDQRFYRDRSRDG